ncbi:TraB/GumN family protein [Alkalisalibacterium limincola]|uniref:TraB/GumN family protein n=1 Tax=Alkalisalibacterium limincola TaxID=2699169 RepID=A0A5C8KYM1_9GAMM|nr:TraB/GumN family protein [Alkalisalibacterium limincola]TXK64457.1 TraB/GumN family protein [Alkalisalibacterium limincola]
MGTDSSEPTGGDGNTLQGIDDPTLPDRLEKALLGQPILEVERDGIHYTLLGTAHISQASIDAVEALVASGRFDAVAVELDEQRLRALTDVESLHKLDLFAIIREGKVGLVAANLALAAYQRRLAEKLGVQPGAELKAAAEGADAAGVPVVLIDREVGLTLRRAWTALGFWGRMKLAMGLAGSLFTNDDVDEAEIEKLKQGDMLERSFGEFAAMDPALYEAVIAERDEYMALRLREHGAAAGPTRVLAVVGAGHLKGLAERLAHDKAEPATARGVLEQVVRKRSIPWITILVALAVVGGLAWGFSQGREVGASMALGWVLTTGTLGALGCLAAGGHPLAILAAFVASPFTPFHRLVPSGMISAGVQAWLRKPTYRDFLYLRDDTNTLRGWWRNRVSHVLVVFFLTSLGTSIGVWISIFRIAGRMAGG